MIDPKLKDFATEAQWKKLKALDEHGSERKAAKALGCHPSAVGRAHRQVRAKAAREGYAPEAGIDTAVPEGYILQGTSILRDEDGHEKLRWEKINKDAERQKELFREMVEAFKDELPAYKPTTYAPAEGFNENLLACYPVGDHHLGMLAWGEETGEDYDIAIGTELLDKAMDALVNAAPPSHEALIALMGDFLHYDSYETVTPTSRNNLDADGRYPKMVRAAIYCARMLVRKALVRHGHVTIIVEIGNHDLATSVFLRECLAAVFEDDERVSVDTSPSHFHYFEFGNVLIGTHHGHSCGMDKLPLVMANDRREAWGRTEYRYWWTGHIHKDTVKDIEGVRVETFRILPPGDAFAHTKGYRPGRDMKCIVMHREHGEVARHLVNPKMLEE